MAEKEFVHLDMHEGNIFYKQDEQGHYKWYLIDYGRVYDRTKDGELPVELKTIIPRANDERRFENMGSLVRYATRHLVKTLYEFADGDSPLKSTVSELAHGITQVKLDLSVAATDDGTPR